MLSDIGVWIYLLEMVRDEIPESPLIETDDVAIEVGDINLFTTSWNPVRR